MGITERVFDSYQDRPQAAILMSGSGSNAETILSSEKLRDLYDFVVVASDNFQSNASSIATTHKIPSLIQHQDRFGNQEEREYYFDELSMSIARYGASVAIYAGFMKIASPTFCEAFPGVNVHPADLSVIGDDGLPKYRGMRALSSMRADLGFVRSTVHVVDNPVDSGSAISLSESFVPDPEMHNAKVHDHLKLHEHAVYTLTLEFLGLGELNPSEAPYNYGRLLELKHE
jgi:phosphoribosylglycinamide formyltransferase-1